MGLPGSITDISDQHKNTKANVKAEQNTAQLLAVARDVLNELRQLNRTMATATAAARPSEPTFVAYPPPPVPPSATYIRTGTIVDGRRMTAAGTWEDVVDYQVGDSANGHRLTVNGWVPE